ncbi:FAD binding domain-containing protein [Xanthobacter tagetidis]|uniref:Xanthine dehydrogenase family protein subunit M n=1 Tax=Xanthobacter tagetidis TaxID=60216 RepID=A0A3L7AK89_9HYPH|nr:FAD binding domain-containing protein [Xanthobacter tagetidis]MBB6309075.1 CO/xanthine dehydrogenase FAD-binding subunit [Xanthobacter tagetidis]RLP80434.1 xanthine dehydrogenase family protein subunit M [Xanthobacter tagetidis]
MKPAEFAYVRPASVAEACAVLASNPDARVVAGGQTLVPMLAMRLARPSILVDILRLPELAGIAEEPGTLVIGATTRQVEAERSSLVASRLPLLAAALPWVGHPPTRNRGTVGGSLANADPSAEIPLVAVALEAEIVTEDEGGRFAMPADDFFIGPMLTAAPEAGLLTQVRFPVWSEPCVGVGFHEVSARRSDFAFVSAAAQVALDPDGRCTRIALGIGGVGDRPVRLDVAGLVGTRVEGDRVAQAVEAAAAVLEPTSDLHASAAYRRRVAILLGARAIGDAVADAQEKGAGR